jgi:hypothetical protein
VGPVAGEVVEGLVVVVSRDVDGDAVAGAAVGDVGEFAAAAVVVAVDGVEGGALGAVHGGGVAVVETLVEARVVERVAMAVVERDSQRPVCRIDVGDGAGLLVTMRP